MRLPVCYRVRILVRHLHRGRVALDSRRSHGIFPAACSLASSLTETQPSDGVGLSTLTHKQILAAWDKSGEDANMTGSKNRKTTCSVSEGEVAIEFCGGMETKGGWPLLAADFSSGPTFGVTAQIGFNLDDDFKIVISGSGKQECTYKHGVKLTQE